ncbi:cortex morphogenetic protein CmpA [Salibacterium salarium]|uniref:Cortex morphogenetic protein CmpA n=1 Tax=Salibacterium salarium TaxID=284579 RepID=A0A428MSL7_9BACI|nr:cortex morphogenetic protein CmpA [Salibacterium salarium]RSL29153.1 cortex morphogenetic protein CmpA [Salibacterium salarium]
MPGWFIKQMEKAFFEKNRREIRVLNQCWFDYKFKQRDLASDKS